MPSIFGKSGPTGRAKPRHKSIRGTISAPIPIPKTDDDEFPMRNPGSAKALVTVDDEFPMRMPGTGIATSLPPADAPSLPSEEPLGLPSEHGPPEQPDQQPCDGEPSPGSSSEREQEQEEQIPTQIGAAAPTGDGVGGSRTDLAEDARLEPPSTAPPAPPTTVPAGRPASQSPPRQPSPRKSSPLGASPSSVSPQARRATNPALSAVRYSIVSDAPSKHTVQTRDSPQRKKSTLRSALGRLFGRGRKKNGNGNQDLGAGSRFGSGQLGSAQHRSDPTALGRAHQRSPKRSASLPISELDRPLRSHSVGPDDIMAIESARNSLQVEAAPGIRRRAATTGGHTLLRPHLSSREWGGGLSPRPASAQGRASRAGTGTEPEDPNEIGRAITSDSAGGLRRRSRSLSGLQDLGIQSTGRRRSDEIRYWRESYDPGLTSPLSSNAQDDADTGVVEVGASEDPAVEKPPKTPPQPFNFGLLSKEMIGMKITHAANMDTRLGNLESRTLRLERVVDYLCPSVPGFGAPGGLKDPARPGSSRRSTETDTHSQASFGESPPHTGSFHPLSLPATKAQSSTTSMSTASRPLNRPTSDSTVRGAPSLPTLGREAFKENSNEPRDDLIAQLRSDLDAERAARRALEAQVKKLSERVNTLSKTMFAMVRGPSESRSHERLAPPSAPSSPPMVQTPKTLLVPPPSREQLSVFETDDDDEDGEESDAPSNMQSPSPTKTELEEGEITEDDFQTPREERTPIVSYGAFGEELRADEDEESDRVDEDDPKRKKAARTLSLSQLTLGKGQRTRV